MTRLLLPVVPDARGMALPAAALAGWQSLFKVSLERRDAPQRDDNDKSLRLLVVRAGIICRGGPIPILIIFRSFESYFCLKKRMEFLNRPT